jgi:hypothetical protein
MANGKPVEDDSDHLSGASRPAISTFSFRDFKRGDRKNEITAADPLRRSSATTCWRRQ